VLQMPIAMRLPCPRAHRRCLDDRRVARHRPAGGCALLRQRRCPPSRQSWTRFSAHRVHGAAGSRASGRDFPAALLVILPGEFAIGFLLGLTLQLIFEAGQIAGQVCGVQMGYSLASLMNPDNSQADSGVLSTFYELIVLLLFLQLGVPHWLLRGLGRSFEYLPPGHFSLTWPAVHALFEFSGGMFVAGLQIAAPVVVASLFADAALGFIGKASPQLPVLFVGISIKNLLACAAVRGVALWPRFFDARFGRALDASERILKLAH